jgi:protein-tyrosine phosphatase
MSAEISRIFEVRDYQAEVAAAANLLRKGGVVVLPTETVYGAAAVLTRPEGLARLRALRGGDTKPFTIHLAHRENAMRYLGEVGEVGMRLMKKLWPGPVAIVFDVPALRRAEVSTRLGIAEGELYDSGRITLRCPDHIIATEVIEQIDEPVVLTLAGSAPQGSVDQIAAELADQVDLVIDAGPTRYSKPSTIVKARPGDERGYEIVRAGVYDERIIERLLRTTILFVCSGNTCRSAMAEGLARTALARRLNIPQDELEKKGIVVMSAGAMAMPGNRAAPQAVEAVKPLGADLSRHRSRPLTVELVHQADAIFTMSRAHASAVASLVPSAAEKTFTLDPAGDIDDPIGGDLSLYQQLAGQMAPLVEKRLEEKVQI